MKELIILVGPPGSGKSTFSENLIITSFKTPCPHYNYINQDSQQKEHLNIFKDCILNNKSMIVDRMNFNKKQRERYIKPAREAGYKVKIIVLYTPKSICQERMKLRWDKEIPQPLQENHPTIKLKEDADNAISFFFKSFEKPTPDEADEIEEIYWYDNYEKDTLTTSQKIPCIVCDVDNTLANTDHRNHFLANGNRHWKGFFDAMDKDLVNDWCKSILHKFKNDHLIVLCSGRPDNYREMTENWLKEHKIHYDHLFMRARNDNRPDEIVKEQIFLFEIKPRFKVNFWLDDRKKVIEKIRENNILVLDCAGEKGNF